jgi:hypothetical protein
VSRSVEERAAHTPGPWQTSFAHNAVGYPCFFIHGMSGEQKRDEATLAANAHLIAAAPDLLALAKQYASECAGCGGKGTRTISYGGDGYGNRCAARVDADDQPCPDCADIRAVIDKAEGR